MDKWEVFKSAESLAKAVGASGRKLSKDELQSLSDSVNTVWVEINPHNSMELLSLIERKVGSHNADPFLRRVIPVLEKQPNYISEVETNSAGHCLVAAVLVNDMPDLIDSQLIRAQAQRLSSYRENNCLYTREELRVMRRHIMPYL